MKKNTNEYEMQRSYNYGLWQRLPIDRCEPIVTLGSNYQQQQQQYDKQNPYIWVGVIMTAYGSV